MRNEKIATNKLSELTRHKFVSNSNDKLANLPLFEIGLYIILFIFFTVLTATALLVVNIPISPVSIIFGFLFSIITMYFFVGRDWKKLFVFSLVFIILFLLCVGISSSVYDTTWDGEAYHKNAVGLLNLGWSPIYETSTESIKRLNLESIIPTGTIIADVYAKASWIFATSCYSIFGDIESGKCYTLLGMLALFCVAYSFLTEKFYLRWWQAGISAFFVSVNPVTLSQMFTYYNDGFLGTLVLIYIFCFLYLSYGEKHKHKFAVYALIFASACIGMNVKFSGLMYFGIFGAIFYFFWIYQWFRKNGWKKSFNKIRNLSIFFTILVLCSCLLFGSTVYIPNTINHQNPVYGLIGDTNIASIDGNTPLVLRETPGTLRFVSSLFSESSNSINQDTLNLKIPFTFTISEGITTTGCDCRIAGWGVTFSGIFIIGVICMLITLSTSWKKDREVFNMTFILLLGILIPSIVITGMWWARYNSLLFLIQLFAFVFLFVCINRIQNDERIGKSLNLKKIGVISCLILLIGASVINVTPGLLYRAPNDIVNSWTATQQIDYLSSLPEGTTLDVTVHQGNYRFYGRLFNLYDEGIKYKVVSTIENPDGSVLGYYGFRYKIIS